MNKKLISFQLEEVEFQLNNLQKKVMCEEDGKEEWLNELTIAQFKMGKISGLLIESYIRQYMDEAVKTRNKEVAKEISKLLKYI
ncbi:hypothetical protein GCM10011351_14630 [Paraliobacillus quinghaiensis]|uniref:Uncharacterized protein n=1 Tax=Paraliobacillus quinghaiensis TaxID=470815 RepID=A0A917TMY4_9BACI|nr:hypothetical protein [Paraliobacillus quinghaiensis]GGM29597.1 hypothetical protein GCM10011351_14630 [Paraliobacillus quinghaiensis]